MDSIFGHSLPITAIIPTSDRAEVLERTFISLSEQNVQPSETIVIDASEDNKTYLLCNSFKNLSGKLLWVKADTKGAAIQREQGLNLAKNDFILFIDDDIILERNCIKNLWDTLLDDNKIGGVNAMVTNQRYQKPGRITQFFYHLMSGEKLESYAGKCIGPAWNIWPEDKESLPLHVQVEWLSTVCALYRKESLPRPAFPAIFKGYSYMEDVHLSLSVAKTWKLYNARNAKIYHDSQPGVHKNSTYKIAKMQIVNRHYIMRNTMDRNSFKDYCKLFLLESFMVSAQVKDIKKILPYFLGKVVGIFTIILKIRS